MGGFRISKATWLLVPVIATGLVVYRPESAQAQRSGQVIGAGAAGLALGLVLGGMASQSNAANDARQGSPKPRVYRKTNSQNASPGGAAQSRAEIEKIQESLNLLGYDVGVVDGSMGRQTQVAIKRFQADRGLQQTGRLSASERQMLFADVTNKQPTRGGSPPAIAEPQQQEQKPDPRLELAHWESVRNSKVPAELEDYIGRYPNGEFTKLAELRLKLVKQDVTPQDDPKRPSPGTASPGTTTAQSLPEIDAASLPKARQRRGDAVAVIIGNSTYRHDVPKVEFALRDAQAMKQLAAKTLGLDEQNIIFLNDATRAAMDKVFGTERDHKGELWRTIDPDGRSDVFVFYSGHGMPGINDSRDNFLMPVDGDPQHANLNGYPLSLLYKNLGDLQTKSTTVFLDACFSGQSPDGAGTPLIKHASPIFISKATPSDSSKINVFSAANERQLSSWDMSTGYGIFTRFVLLGLSGEADEDKNKEITAKELSEYVGRQVRRTARRAHGREQQPQFSGNPDFVISSY